ncbi:MAG: outer membrane beta-barrel domain-containing protein [Bdellovibrionales bacterium]|nr:outer membrane beta-barrel domain-containing protein [Bdellovibrionales bacterium]
MKRLSLILLSLFAINAFAAKGDLTSEMDALGANKDLMKKARAIDPENRIRVVQNRDVDRRLRLEIGVNAALVEGGDPYVNTNTLGANLDFHITPRWSVGARYSNYTNTSTAEGKRVYEDAAKDKTLRFPGFDYAKNSWMGVVNWYPIYGKLNMFDLGISQFDIYFLGGAGQVFLGSGTEPIYTAGGGAGIWLAQHLSMRLEARWQGFTDHPQNGNGGVENRSINETVLGLSFGFLL